MTNVAVPSIAAVTAAAGDTVLGVKDGAVKRLTGVTYDAVLAAVTGASLVGFTQAGTGTVARTLQDKARELVNAKDFGVTGDGVTDDAATLLAACASNRRLRLGAGSFNIGSVITLSGLSNLVIEGDGAQTTLNVSGDYKCFALTNCTNVTFRNLRLVGSANVLHATSTGISIISGCTNITIRDCYIEDFGYDGIHALYDTAGLLVTGCHISGCGDDGINPGGGGGTPGTKGSMVIGNRISNCTHDGVHVSDGSLHTTVVGNTIEGCQDGVSLYNATFATVTGNTIRNSTQYGVGTEAAGCADCVIADNIIEGSLQGIRVAQNAVRFAVRGNVIRNPTNYGIIFSHDSASAADSVVEGNVISGVTNSDGINLFQCTNVTIRGNRIVGAGGVGIKLGTSATKNTVDGNDISGTASYGIHCSDATSPASDSIIRGNRVNGAPRGIFIDSAQRVQVDGNRITSATDYGIILTAASALDTAGTVSNNLIEGGCASGGIRLSAYKGLVVNGNRVTNITSSLSISGNASTDAVLVVNNYCKGTISTIGAASISANNIVSTGL